MQDQTSQSVPTDTQRPDFMNLSAEEAKTPTPLADPPQANSSVLDPAPPPSSSGSGSGKRIAAILGIMALVGATGLGVFLAGRQQLQPASAWDCGSYNFSVTREGSVSVVNGSTRNEPPQKANVKVNNAQVATFDVPALSAGQSANLGNVDVPAEGGFSWEVIGASDCRDGGSYQGSGTVSCQGVKAFNKDWQQLSAVSLAALKPGDIVRFTVASTATSGNIDKARFVINGTQRAEVTTKRPGTEEYFDEYTVPTGVTTFSVTVQLHHQQNNQWN